MANENLIAYENAEKQKNLEKISELNNKILSIDDSKSQMSANIVFLDSQKDEALQQISDVEAGNVIIDEIISILSA